MDEGVVRRILWTHLCARAGPRGEPPWDPAADAPWPDPNALLPAGPFTLELQRLEQEQGPAAVRALGHDWARLWHRTFRRLVRHLRGRPEDMLALFATEVWPYLRGGEAGVVVGPRQVRLGGGLPDEYVAGLLEGFVRLTGVHAEAVRESGAWRVGWRIDPRLRLARWVRLGSAMRIPLLLAASLSGAVGVAVALGGGHAPAWRAAAALGGVLGAQAAANAVPDLRRRGGPLDVAHARPRMARAQAAAGALVAVAAAALLLPAAPWLPAFAVAGGAVGAGFGWLRDHGMGPVATALVHGPLVAAGAAYAVAPAGTWLLAAAAAVPVGLGAAALVHVGDMADRGLDMARGHRTLAVRLPARADAWLPGLLLVAMAAAAALLAWWRPPASTMATGAALGALGVGSLLVAADIRRHVDDPTRLATGRAATLALMVSAAVLGAGVAP